MLKGKEILLGISGGIAAYKTVLLLRKLTKEGANVNVIMTEHAKEFVGPLTFQTLSGNPVTSDLFTLFKSSEIGHVALADKADLLVIAPATANIIGKIAHGIGDDFLSTMVMATRVPVLFAPSMNVNMYHSPVVQDNIRKLKDFGYYFIDPVEGELACKVEGKGKLADVDDILEEIHIILSSNDFKGKKILITAGPTIEDIDPVRYISNNSSGKMGYALAKMAIRRGAEVLLISGPTALEPPYKSRFIKIRSAREMFDAVMDNFSDYDIIIKSAAVADFKPEQVSTHKIKKVNGEFQINLSKNSDILFELGKYKGERLLVGFAAESENFLDNAYKKLKEKNVDLMVVNDISNKKIGFKSDFNECNLIFKDGSIRHIPFMDKDTVSDDILDAIKSII
jgi:phosphopantothenoylcysteine decarboxylase/phosphopantothenate--cysteine ligase